MESIVINTAGEVSAEKAPSQVHSGLDKATRWGTCLINELWKCQWPAVPESRWRYSWKLHLCPKFPFTFQSRNLNYSCCSWVLQGAEAAHSFSEECHCWIYYMENPETPQGLPKIGEISQWWHLQGFWSSLPLLRNDKSFSPFCLVKLSPLRIFTFG